MRRAADHGQRLGARGIDKARDLVGAVLAVGVDLHRVRIALAQRRAQAGHHRRALALVVRQMHDLHALAMPARQRVQHGRAIGR
ncbi:hypothetical protein D3C78_1825290 [compost metagenome]